MDDLTITFEETEHNSILKFLQGWKELNEKMKVTTPEEFLNKVIDLKANHSGDSEALHHKTDRLMENLLIELGYEEGVKQIQHGERWYA